METRELVLPIEARQTALCRELVASLGFLVDDSGVKWLDVALKPAEVLGGFGLSFESVRPSATAIRQQRRARLVGGELA